MLREEDIAIDLKCQQYICKSYMRNLEGTESVLLFESKQKTEDVFCPFCHGSVHICDMTGKTLKDIPIWKGIEQYLHFNCHRYRCTQCGRTHTEEIPLKYPGTRITERAEAWIHSLLLNKVSIKSIQNITGIHWETIRNIHVRLMESTLQEHHQGLQVILKQLINSHCQYKCNVDKKIQTEEPESSSNCVKLQNVPQDSLSAHQSGDIARSFPSA